MTIAILLGLMQPALPPSRAGVPSSHPGARFVGANSTGAVGSQWSGDSLRAAPSGGGARALRIETRNLGHFLNTDLNACEHDKVRDLIAVLTRDAHTDVFLFQEISPDLRPTLLREVGGLYEITMAERCTDVAVLVRRGVGTRVSWAEHRAFQVEQEGVGQVGCSRYGAISATYSGPLGAHTFVSVHLPSDALSASSTTDGDVHRMRCRLLRELEQLVAQERSAGRVAIVGGDFNIDPAQDRPDGLALRRFLGRAHTTDANRQPTVLGLWRYDHIVVFSPGAGLNVLRPPQRFPVNEESFAQGIRWTDHRGVPLEFQCAPAIVKASDGRGGDARQ